MTIKYIVLYEFGPGRYFGVKGFAPTADIWESREDAELSALLKNKRSGQKYFVAELHIPEAK